MALLGRYATINRFGTDDFTGNILFVVFFILLVGLYVSIQPVFETIFKRLFSQRTPALVVAEMPNGTHANIPANDESVNVTHCSSTAPTQESEVCEADVEFDDDSTNNEFEIIDRNDGLCHVRFVDGSEAHVGEDLSDDEIIVEKTYLDNLDDDYSEERLIERHTFVPHGDGCPSFEE